MRLWANQKEVKTWRLCFLPRPKTRAIFERKPTRLYVKATERFKSENPAILEQNLLVEREIYGRGQNATGDDASAVTRKRKPLAGKWAICTWSYYYSRSQLDAENKLWTSLFGELFVSNVLIRASFFLLVQTYTEYTVNSVTSNLDSWTKTFIVSMFCSLVCRRW